MDWRKFSIYMVGGSLLLFLIAPLWGFACRDIAGYLGLAWVYGLYLTMLPWVVFYGIAGIWLLRNMPAEGM